jgi:hypothetical protein
VSACGDRNSTLNFDGSMPVAELAESRHGRSCCSQLSINSAEARVALVWKLIGIASASRSCLPALDGTLENSRTIDRGRINMSVNNTDRWQALMQPAFLFAGIMQENARRFWTCHADMLNEMEAFSEGWFERRHAGTRAALEACERMCTARMPTEWLSAYQKWLIGVGERLMADAQAWSKMTKRSEGLAPSLIPSTDQDQRGAVTRVTEKRGRAHVG